MSLKTCCRCGVAQPTTSFGSRGNGKFHSHCKTCQSAYDKQKWLNYTPEQKQKAVDRVTAFRNKAYPNRRAYVKGQTVDEKRLNVRSRASILLRQAKERSVRYPTTIFDLTHEWVVEKLLAGVCEKSGVQFDLSKPATTYRNPFGPSIDRVDNSLGYCISNSQIVCTMYNLGKSQYTDKQFITFCKQVAAFNP